MLKRKLARKRRKQCKKSCKEKITGNNKQMNQRERNKQVKQWRQAKQRQKTPPSFHRRTARDRVSAARKLFFFFFFSYFWLITGRSKILS